MTAPILNPDDPRHGTPAGAWAHARADDPACDPCADALRQYNHARQQQRNTGNPPGRPPILVKAAVEDVDEVVVERHLQGRACPANTAERIEIVRVWRAQGRPLKQLEALVAWNVYRYVRVLQQHAA